ncbi:MAG: PD40 domain-containing protein, partial [Deltaproteobacteria bacterium]|nr:PD40 domain-containing protein [Deltaproteobacteria bacterium]
MKISVYRVLLLLGLSVGLGWLRDDHPRWASSGQSLAFLSERGDSTLAQIYLINPQGGEAQPLTKHKTAVQTFEWSPDSRYIAFIAEEPKPEPKEKPKNKPPIVVDEEPRYAQLWVIEIATGQVKQLTKGARHITALGWSYDNTQLVFTAAPEPETLLAAAQTNNFEMRMRQVELEQQGFKVSLAKNERYPAVTIGPYYALERADDRQ